MKDLECKIINTIKKYNMIEKGDRIVLAVSGGPDSMCMLNAFIKMQKENLSCHLNPEPMAENLSCHLNPEPMAENLSCHLNPEPMAENSGCHLNPEPMAENSGCHLNPELMAISVAHVNHMIRDEASEDELFVKDFCEKNNVDFYSKSIDVRKLANNNKIGTEEAGRMARYDFFEEVLQITNSNKIAIAHNKNDNAETVIMNLLRGSGVTGLKGIEPKRKNYIRPLIECEREEIEQYCKEENLNPRIDKTNSDNIYTRNKIRNIVIPYIKKEFNPNIINTLGRLSKIVSEEEEYVERQVENIFYDILIEEVCNENNGGNSGENSNKHSSKEDNKKYKEIVLDLKLFNEQEKVIKSRLVLYTIIRIFGNAQGIEKIHIEDIIKLCSNNIGNKYLTPNKKIKILVKNHKIYFISQV